MRAKKVDRNHAEIVNHVRSIGWRLLDTSAVGRGMGDALVSRLGHTAILEIKNGKAEPNDLQRRFRDSWDGAYFVVRSPEEAEKQLSAWLLTLVAWKK